MAFSWFGACKSLGRRDRVINSSETHREDTGFCVTECKRCVESLMFCVWTRPQSSVQLNRRVLSDLAVTEPRTFQALVALARARQQEGLRAALGDGKEPPGVFSRITQLQWWTARTANHSFSVESVLKYVCSSVAPSEGVWRKVKKLGHTILHHHAYFKIIRDLNQGVEGKVFKPHCV